MPVLQCRVTHANGAYIMYTEPTAGKPAPAYLELAAGKALTVRGRRGTVVRCLQGRVWVTQDGDPRDYVVPAHARYCSGSRGNIVVSAISGNCRIAVYRVHPSSGGDWSRNAVRIDADFVESVRESARREQSRQIGALALRIWHRARQAWQRFLRSRSRDPGLRMRGDG